MGSTMNMPLDWREIALRLGITFLAGAIIGFNREERRRPAGLRTTVLVCLAAAGAMVLANLLMGTTGRSEGSFVTMDVMRLPLGILTGVGFIGAGAILHKENLVVGVTTAATLWFSTVMGLCFGAGEIGIGLILLVLGIVILWLLKWIEDHLMTRSFATLTIVLAPDGPALPEALGTLRSAGYKCSVIGLVCREEGRELRLNIRRIKAPHEDVPEDLIRHLKTGNGIKEFRWSL